MNQYQNLDNQYYDPHKPQPNYQDQTQMNQPHPFNYTDEVHFDSTWTMNVRKNFIKKVYSIIFIQLLITFLMTLAIFLSKDFLTFTKNHLWLTYVCIGIYTICVYALACYQAVARSVPINYIVLFILTLAMSYIVATIASVYQPETVLVAAGLTVAMVLGLTIYAFTTKSDFTTCGGVLIVCCVVMLIGGIVAIFWRNKWLQLGLSILGVIVFGIYLVFDTQLLFGEKKNKFGVDDYVWAAVNIYIDIVQIFLYILQIIGTFEN